ncbi:hypothetical protein BC831DRAFT_458038, partial [Entophlyctis helioformis]
MQSGQRMQSPPPPQIEEHQQSTQRLASLGIFELEPKARKEVMRDPRIEISKIDLQSFETPNHRPADKVGFVSNITGPQLLSTSSRMRTIPIDVIRRDLIASGRWTGDDDDSGMAVAPPPPAKKSSSRN